MKRRMFLKGLPLMAGTSSLFSWNAFGQGVEERKKASFPIVLLPLGSGLEGDLLEAVALSLEKGLGAELIRRPQTDLPAFAYHPPRKRYRAEKLLTFLGEQIKEETAGTRILGLTAVDISTTKGSYPDWGIFGLGEIGGPACVVATWRLKPGAKSQGHFFRRVANTANHEIGHTLGLPHCPVKGCVMQDAEGGIKNTDSSSGGFCPRCQGQIRI